MRLQQTLSTTYKQPLTLDKNRLESVVLEFSIILGLPANLCTHRFIIIIIIIVIIILITILSLSFYVMRHRSLLVLYGVQYK